MPKKKHAKTNPQPELDDSYVIRYFKRHHDDDPTETVPAQAFLRSVPKGVAADFYAVLVAVAKAPPTKFSGGGYWEAMHGEMAGWHEVRVDGPARHHYRLFCRLESPLPRGGQNVLAIICGLSKPFRTEFRASDYAGVRSLGDEFLKRTPRSYA